MHHSTPEPTETSTAFPTNTPRPSPTPGPTKTPNLLQSRPRLGKLGLTVLPGTDRDYGTRCEMTDLRLWIPKE